MANNITGRQWKLDTVGVVYKHRVKIEQVLFSGYADATNRVILTDIHGRVVLDTVGNADLSQQRVGYIGWVDGLVLDTLTAGTVIVHIS